MESTGRPRHPRDVKSLSPVNLLSQHLAGDKTSTLDHGQVTPALKKELRLSIMAKRQARGEGEITVDIRMPEVFELTTTELEKKERRREQNRRAAQRCRRKKRLSQMSILQHYEHIMARNQQLQEEVSRLRQDQAELQATLKAHLDACTCSLSSVLPHAPRVKREPRERSPCLPEDLPNLPSSSSLPTSSLSGLQHGRPLTSDLPPLGQDVAQGSPGARVWQGDSSTPTHSYPRPLQGQQQQGLDAARSNFLYVQDSNNNSVAVRPAHLADIYLSDDNAHGVVARTAAGVSPGLPDSAAFFSADFTLALPLSAAHPPDVTARARRSLLPDLTFAAGRQPRCLQDAATAPHTSDSRGSASSDSDVSMGCEQPSDICPTSAVAGNGGEEVSDVSQLLSQLTHSDLLLLQDVLQEDGGGVQDSYLHSLVQEN